MQFAFATNVTDELFVWTEVYTTNAYALGGNLLAVALKVFYLLIIHHTDGETEGAQFVNRDSMTLGKPTFHLVNHTAHDFCDIALIQS